MRSLPWPFRRRPGQTACLAGHVRPDGRLAAEDLYPVLNCCSPEISGPAVGDLDGRPDIAVAAGADVAVLYQK